MDFDKLYYARSENIFLVKIKTSEIPGFKLKRYSPYFDYTSPGEGEIVELTCSDEQLPMFRASYFDPSREDDMTYLFPGIPETVLANSTLVFSDDDTEQAEKGYSIPVMFCFSTPYLTTSMDIPVGTTSPYDSGGSGWGSTALNFTWNNGIRNRRYVQYDFMLGRSNHQVYCLLRLPLSILQTMDLTRPKLLFGQPVLVEHVKCHIGTGIFEITETAFRTLRHYEDSD
jgi:hypothetical protein